MVKRETVIKSTWTGLTPIMFDRYGGDNSKEVSVDRKMYLLAEDMETVVIPSANISSFLSAENTPSVCKRFMDSREYKKMAAAYLSNISVEPYEIPILRDGKPVMFGGFTDDKDAKSGMYVDRRVARLAKGIPNPKVRPVLPLPWAIEFEMRVFPNEEMDLEQLYDLVRRGGVAIGLGTFRGVFGKFRVDRWDVK
jgi:hypothetical protein